MYFWLLALARVIRRYLNPSRLLCRRLTCLCVALGVTFNRQVRYYGCDRSFSHLKRPVLPNHDRLCNPDLPLMTFVKRSLGLPGGRIREICENSGALCNVVRALDKRDVALHSTSCICNNHDPIWEHMSASCDTCICGGTIYRREAADRRYALSTNDT